MESKLSTPVILLILMSLILSVMLVSGCAAAARPTGPQESVEPQGPVGPQGAVGPKENVGSQASVGPQEPMGPQETVRPHGPVSLEEPVGRRGRISPADPLVFVARVLKTIGLATERG